MFKNYKEMKELKKVKMQLEVIILSKIYNVINLFDTENYSDEDKEAIIDLTKKMKNIKEQDVVKEVIKNIRQGEN